MILLARHGRTQANGQGKFIGQSDIPLNATGREQARSLATSLRHDGIRRLCTSPLQRTVQTAEIIARCLGGTRETLATVAGTVLAQTLLNLLALAILAIVAAAGGELPGARTGVIIVALALPAALLAALSVAPGPLRSPGAPRLHRLARCAAWVANQVVQMRRGLTVFRRPRPATHAAAAQLAVWAIQCASCYAVILAFDLQHHATFAVAAAVLLVVNLTAIVPLTPSNLGVFQAACIAVLAPFGVLAGRALAYGPVLQAVEVLAALALGLPALLHEGLTLPELRRQAHNHLTGAAEGEVKANSGGHRRRLRELWAQR